MPLYPDQTRLLLACWSLMVPALPPLPLFPPPFLMAINCPVLIAKEQAVCGDGGNAAEIE